MLSDSLFPFFLSEFKVLVQSRSTPGSVRANEIV